MGRFLKAVYHSPVPFHPFPLSFAAPSPVNNPFEL